MALKLSKLNNELTSTVVNHRSLQIRGLVELERKREAEGLLTNSVTGSPIKQRLTPDNDHGMMHNDGGSIGSGGGNDRSAAHLLIYHILLCT